MKGLKKVPTVVRKERAVRRLITEAQEKKITLALNKGRVNIMGKDRVFPEAFLERAKAHKTELGHKLAIDCINQTIDAISRAKNVQDLRRAYVKAKDALVGLSAIERGITYMESLEDVFNVMARNLEVSLFMDLLIKNRVSGVLECGSVSTAKDVRDHIERHLPEDMGVTVINRTNVNVFPVSTAEEEPDESASECIAYYERVTRKRWVPRDE